MKLVESWLAEPKENRQAHLDLTEACTERGGISTNHRGVLAQYLDTNIPKHPCVLCHACNNPACSNPRHLYWGTYSENLEDSVKAGTHANMWERMVAKHGLEEARKIQGRKGAATAGIKKVGCRKPKSVDHKAKIAEAIKAKHAAGDYKDSPVGRKKRG